MTYLLGPDPEPTPVPVPDVDGPLAAALTRFLGTGRPFIHTEGLYVSTASGSPAQSIASTGSGNPRITPNPWTYTVGVTPPGGTVLLGQPGAAYVNPGYL